MPQAVTIDNYDIEIHERYATDQANFDPSLFHGIEEISSHFAISAKEARLISKWEELFGIHLHRHPFACFTPPPFHTAFRNRLFSYVISKEFDWENEEENEERKEEKRQAEEYKKRIQAKKTKKMPAAIFEKDRKALLNLIDSIQTLNGFLKEIHARKLQYQKG